MVSEKGMSKTVFFSLLRNWHCISRESAPKLFSWIQRLSGNKLSFKPEYFTRHVDEKVHKRARAIFRESCSVGIEGRLHERNNTRNACPWRILPFAVHFIFNCTRNLMDGHGRGVIHVLYFLRAAQWLVRHGNHDSTVPKRRIILICCFTLENTLIICDSSSNENLKKIILNISCWSPRKLDLGRYGRQV